MKAVVSVLFVMSCASAALAHDIPDPQIAQLDADIRALHAEVHILNQRNRAAAAANARFAAEAKALHDFAVWKMKQ